MTPEQRIIARENLRDQAHHSASASGFLSVASPNEEGRDRDECSRVYDVRFGSTTY